MKEIEFRAWNTENMSPVIEMINKPFEQPCVDLQDGSRVCGCSSEECLYPGVIMQYTGLKDKNGKKIFEGDVINRWKVDLCLPATPERIVKTSEVIFNEDELIYEIEGNTNIGIYGGYNCLEVIGNIYSTPELLTTK